MDTLKAIVSKANSIRFAHKDGNKRSFDNTLSHEEVSFNNPTPVYCQKYFYGDSVYLQIKAGLTATVVLTRHLNTGLSGTIAVSNVETYSEYKIYEYIITNNIYYTYYLELATEQSTWESEWCTVIAPEDDNITKYMLLQWSNLDEGTDTFEFDYNTTLALANVNFMRILAKMQAYKPSGITEVYDNQNEKTKLKGSLFRNLTFEAEPVPTPIAELITIAMQHDLFLVNDVGYVVEDLPNIDMFGGKAQVTAELTVTASLGLNTHDIGFDCDTIIDEMIENKEVLNTIGIGTFNVSTGYGITQIIAKKISGNPVLKIGSTSGGEEIFREEEITGVTPPLIDNNRFVPTTAGTWVIYYEITGGIMDLYIQTIKYSS